MRDYRHLTGRDVNVVSNQGDAFRGPLVDVGKETLTVRVEHYVPAGSDESQSLAGVVMIDATSIHYVQVV